jgi:hypothetical protein
MWETRQYDFHFSFGFGSGHHSYLLPLVGFGAGVGVFANGFWNYRKLRIIENTPRIAVRAVPMGLVHVHGKATGHNLLTSPVTGTRCYYYQVRLQRWEEQGKNKGWNTVHTATERRTFYVEDGTGRILINPQAVEYDLPSTYRAEFGPHAKAGPYLDPSLGLAGPSEQDLRAYAAKADPAFTVAEKVIAQLDPKSGSTSGLAQKLREREKQVFEARNPLTGHGSYRITEHCLVAEHEYDVIGTCAPNPQPQGDDDQNLILKGRNEPTFVISGFSELNLEKVLRKRALSRIAVGGFLIVMTMGIIIAQLVSP